MLTRVLPVLLGIVLLAAGGCGSTPMASRMVKDTGILESVQASPKAIPQAKLQKAHGVAILSTIKVGVGIGGAGGEGILIRRLSDNTWSQPLAVSVGEGSLGVQLGAQGTEAVVVFYNDAGVMKFASGGASMTAKAQGTAGGTTGSESAMTGAPSDTEIYTLSQGLYGGADVGGLNIQVDNKVNEETYGPGVTIFDILENSSKVTPQPGMTRITNILNTGKP